MRTSTSSCLSIQKISVHDGRSRICVTYSEQMKMFLAKDDTSFEQMFISHMTRCLNEALVDDSADDSAEAPAEACTEAPV